MKKTKIIGFTIVIIITAFLFLTIAAGKNTTENTGHFGYPYFFSSVSQDGFFQMISLKCGLSQFRDVESGRLISVYDHDVFADHPEIIGKYIQTLGEDEHGKINEIYLEDRDGNKHTLDPKDGMQILLFDDEIIQLHQEFGKDDRKIWREVDGKIIWELGFSEESGMSGDFGQEINGFQTTDLFRDYVWIIDNENLEYKVLDPRDGETCYEIGSQILTGFKTNGLLAVLTLENLDHKRKMISVVNTDTWETVFEIKKDEYFKSYIYENKATIVIGPKPSGIWDKITHKVYIIDKDNGLEGEYQVTFPTPYVKGSTSLKNAKEHLLCYSIPTKNGLIIKDARTDTTIWEPDYLIYYPIVRVSGDTMVIGNGSESVIALDTKNFDILWKYRLTNTQEVVAEFDGLEYIRVEHVIKVRDTKFNVIEPYEYDISDSLAEADCIPSKYGLVIVPNSKYSTLHEISFLKPGIDEPVYSKFIRGRWVESWERMDNPEYIKLSTTSNESYMKDIVWYLHIPTGFMSIEAP